MRPMLNPGFRRVWRDLETVQFGIDVENPVVVGGIGDDTASLLERLDGSVERATFLDQATRDGHSRERAEQLLEALTSAGLLLDAATWPGGAPLEQSARDRLAPDFAAAALGPSRADPAARCVTLSQVAVRVYGVGRIGAVMATLLAATGFGRVTTSDDADVRAADVCVAGFSPDDVGQPRSRISRHVDQWQAVAAAKPRRRLAVLTDVAQSRTLAPGLFSEGTPHLVVRCAESRGRIGPLVLPGETACLRCLDLSHIDSDPDWPRVVVQSE
ncbi:MAG TPA: ThiF family adenylyltransferase, partial [Actinomycetes bacterium]|nr:ThiF family adenylyltransferase [Actinomycetes bacterium]